MYKEAPYFQYTSFRGLFFRPWQAFVILLAFLLNTFGPIPIAQAQDYRLPAPGVMVHLSPPLEPAMLKGIKVYPDNPFRFDFILDKGDSELNNDQLKNESSKLIKYFLASLTIPEKDLWVNLSPYEKDRIIPNSFGLTEMGRDLLAEDYMLKQITASLIYPEDEIGKKFWKRVYEEAQKKYGTTNIPVNTFNKVWIVPDHAKVYEHGNTAFVVNARLKVMLEEDYLSLSKHQGNKNTVNSSNDAHALGSQIVREIVLPQIEKEVNDNKNFATLRQVYYSLILAVWFKKRMKDSILGHKYMNQNKVIGIDIEDKNSKEEIFQRYLKAFKKGVYNYIKEEPDPTTGDMIPRKYFSGGWDAHNITPKVDFAQAVDQTEVADDLARPEDFARVVVDLDSAQLSHPDQAMNADEMSGKAMQISTVNPLLKFSDSIILTHPGSSWGWNENETYERM
jgi:hypothetical protein